MKIVHLTIDCFFIDGYSYQENIMMKYHAKMGHQVTVIASLVSFDEKGNKCLLPHPCEYMDPNGFKVIRLQYSSPISINRWLRKYEGFKDALEKEHPDIIFSHNLGYRDTSLVANYLKRNPHVKLFCDNHVDYINYGKNWIVRNVLNTGIRAIYAKKLIPYITTSFGVTPMRCRYLKDVYGMPSSLVQFLPMGVDDEAIPADRMDVRKKIRKALEINETDYVIFTGGKIDKLKNTHILIEALQLLNHPDVHLLICGVLTPEMEYLKDIIDSRSNIHYLGWCNAEQVMNYMVSSDIACFPGTHSTLWEQSVGVGIPGIFKLWKEIDHVNINGNAQFVSGDDPKEICRTIKNTIDQIQNGNLSDLCNKASLSFLYSEIAKRAIGL